MELVLSNFGTCLGRDNGGFVVTNADGRQYIPVSGIRTIQISKGSQISSDAVMLAVENEIEILFVDKGGNPVGRVWSPKFGSISTIRKGQIEFTSSHDAVVWFKEILSQKIDNQEAMMMLMDPGDDPRLSAMVSTAVKRLEGYKRRISETEGDCVSDIASTLRGLEGTASRLYFDIMNEFIPIKYRFDQRTQRPAMDVANAMLNYGYGILYSKIEGMMIKTGIDPYVGVMHRDDYNRPVLAYDVIEIYRIWVDYVVYSILNQSIVNEDYYSVREDGSCWLESLGRRILIQSLNDYLDEVVPGDVSNRSRNGQMFLYIQNLAQTFKKNS